MIGNAKKLSLRGTQIEGSDHEQKQSKKKQGIIILLNSITTLRAGWILPHTTVPTDSVITKPRLNVAEGL